MRLMRLAFWGFLFFLAVGYLAGYQKPDPEEFTGLARRAGFPEETIAKARAVATCESGLRPQAVGDGHLRGNGWAWSLGPFQVRTRWDDPFGDRSPFLNLIPAFNAQAAFNISGGGRNWGPWTCG
jgi:hypothetical protein